MSTQISKDNSNKVKKSSSTKEIKFIDFNKRLDDFLTDIKSKPPSYKNNKKYNMDFLNSIEDPFNDFNDIKSGQKSSLNNNENITLYNTNLDKNNKNDLLKYQLEKASNRLEIGKLTASDQFAQNFTLTPSNNFDSTFDLPYTNQFIDNIFLQDESIFFILDKDYKKKFLTTEDIKNFKKEDIKLNFGKDPYEIYLQIDESKISPHDKTSIEFYNSLNCFNIFKTINPYFLNLKMENINNGIEDDNFNMINNFSFTHNDQDNIQNDSLMSTRHNSKINQNNYSIIFNDQHIFNNNNNNESSDKTQEENDKETNIDKFIGKKRINKK